MKHSFNIKNLHWNPLSQLPPKNNRHVVVDTETTGLQSSENNMIEIAAIEIQDGKLTGKQFHAFFHPRYKMNKEAQKKHHMSQNFYDLYYKNVYSSEKDSLQRFLNFVDDSIIFAHNAVFDMHFINNELLFWKLPKIPASQFRCTMKIFKNVIFPFSDKKNYALNYCCEYFNLNSPNENFHSAIYDSFMTARVLCSIYEHKEMIENKNVNNLIEDLNENVLKKEGGKEIIKMGDSDSHSTNSVISGNTNDGTLSNQSSCGSPVYKSGYNTNTTNRNANQKSNVDDMPISLEKEDMISIFELCDN